MTEVLERPKPQKDEKGRFIAGNCGNGGRPRGSRSMLGEEFVADLYADWLENGIATIVQVRAERPADYLKVIASIVPKDLNVRTPDKPPEQNMTMIARKVALAFRLAAMEENKPPMIEGAKVEPDET